MAGRTEKLFKLGVCLYIAGLVAAIAAVAILARVIPMPGDANERGAVLLVVGVGLLIAGWVLRKNTRHG